MDAEKRQAGIGHGVDQAAATARDLRGQREVATPKRDDRRPCGVSSRRSGQTVGVEPGARDRAARFDGAAAGLDPDAAAVVLELRHGGRECDRIAGAFELGLECLRDAPEVDQTTLRNMQPRDPGDVRLDVAQSARGQKPETGEAVAARSPFELLELRPLAFVRRDDELSRDRVRDLMLVAEVDHSPPPRRTQLRLQRPRCVVDAGVEHAAVAAGLVERRGPFLFEYDDLPIGAPPTQLASGREPQDAGAHDDRVRRLGERLRRVAGRRVGCEDSHRPAAP